MDVVRDSLARAVSLCIKSVRNTVFALKKLMPAFPKRPMRSEQHIFEDLRTLCCAPGFVHALAYICFRHNMTFYEKEMKASDMEHLYSSSRIIRTESATLMGLMIRAPIRMVRPPKNVISDYASKAEQLLKELHDTIAFPWMKELLRHARAGRKVDDINVGRLLREAIFYGGESAHSFQYRDIALERLWEDAQWLLDSKGIDIQLAGTLCRSISELLNDRLAQVSQQSESESTNQYSPLPGFVISYAELASRTNAPLEAVRAVIDAFTLPANERNTAFNSIDDFNRAYEYPFIRINEDEFLSLEHYGLPQALYEVPFYWMNQDEEYAPTAAKNRGRFAEAFAAQRLASVFGAGNVYRNVELWKSKGVTLGEIDVLVLYGDRAIVLQAKTKKLTLEARAGSDLKLRDDFQKAIQVAVDQAFECSEMLADATINLRHGGKALNLRQRPTRAYPVSLTAEHYPALTMQVRHFLQAKSSGSTAVPIVIDVFALDAIAELLCSPLRFLSYLSLRVRYGENFLAHHEQTLLSYHLRKILFPQHEDYLEVLDDGITSDLDLAMIVRREGVTGADTPEGILTRAKGTPYARTIAQLENKQNPNYIALGLFLHELSDKSVEKFNQHLTKVMALTTADGRFHGFSTGGKNSVGLTVHCSRLNSTRAKDFLVEQCRREKESRRAERWLGLAIRPDGSILWVRKISSA